LSTSAKGLTILAIILAIGAGLVVWKAKVGGTHGGGHGLSSGGNVTKLSKEDMQLLLPAVIGSANPMALQRLAQDPELKQKLVDNMKEFFAVANQARKEGLAKDPRYSNFLDFIRAQVVAVNYDRERNKDKEALPPFSLVTKEQVDAFYQDPANEAKFNELVNAIKEQGKEEGEETPEPTAEQLAQLKEQYGKVKIYEKEADEKGAELGAEFTRKADLQVKLQQASFLNQLYAAKVLKDKVKVTDEEVQQYIAAHPELDPKAKRTKAEEVLQRVKAGEDFAALANEFSEDPGNKDFKSGEAKGGLIEKVKPDSGFDKNFETTALGLQPGQIAENVVETPFGFHIIKLERKGSTKNKEGKDEETYDVRHILFSTRYSDPKNPFSQPVEISEKVKNDLQAEKEKQILDEIKSKNPVEIEDFEIPKPSEEDIQKMMQQQQRQQMPINPEDLEGEGGEQEAPTTKAPTKPEPKKK
jgi:parvulin-like peptidyl-prolyl isomerase